VRSLVVGLLVIVAFWLLVLAALFVVGRGRAARELGALLPNLLTLFRGLLRDPRVPRRSKFLVGFAVAWLVSPIDLVPEFIPIVGPLDDAIMAALVLRLLIRRAGRGVVADHWRGEPGTLDLILRVAGADRAGGDPAGDPASGSRPSR
jgi:uncharacterized membrane protein YkvA (DUF1232 family)